MKKLTVIVLVLLLAGLLGSQTRIIGALSTWAAQEAEFLSCVDAGSNDTYTCTMNPYLVVYSNVKYIVFSPNTANTGAATLNIDGLGAKPIYKIADGTNLADNNLIADVPVMLLWCGVCNSTNGAFLAVGMPPTP